MYINMVIYIAKKQSIFFYYLSNREISYSFCVNLQLTMAFSTLKFQVSLSPSLDVKWFE